MSNVTVTHSTFVIERNYPSSPERVFSAFSDAKKKRRWFAEGEHHAVENFEMEFRVGGKERSFSRFTEGPFKGTPLVNEVIYQDIVENKRVVTTSTMRFGDRTVSASLVTIELLPAGNGTDLICTHQGAFFEGSDGPEIREGGWQKIFDRLGKELEKSQGVEVVR